MPVIFSLSVESQRCDGHATLFAYALTDSAVSMEAKSAKNSAWEVLTDAWSSQAVFGAKQSAVADLHDLAIECSIDDWDGYGALPINPLALGNAVRLVRGLPHHFPFPEFGPEPDGSISFEWVASRYRLFSLSVGTGNRIAYAWVDGTDRGHGVARCDGIHLPPWILSLIRSILDETAFVS